MALDSCSSLECTGNVAMDTDADVTAPVDVTATGKR